MSPHSPIPPVPIWYTAYDQITIVAGVEPWAPITAMLLVYSRCSPVVLNKKCKQAPLNWFILTSNFYGLHQFGVRRGKMFTTHERDGKVGKVFHSSYHASLPLLCTTSNISKILTTSSGCPQTGIIISNPPLWQALSTRKWAVMSWKQTPKDLYRAQHWIQYGPPNTKVLDQSYAGHHTRTNQVICWYYANLRYLRHHMNIKYLAARSWSLMHPPQPRAFWHDTATRTKQFRTQYVN